MEVMLHTADGEELRAAIENLRGYPSAVVWHDGKQERLFVSRADAGNYQEAKPSLVLQTMAEPSRLTECVSRLRAVAERIHCPDSEGGKVAAGIKADVLTVAESIESLVKTEA